MALAKRLAHTLVLLGLMLMLTGCQKPASFFVQSVDSGSGLGGPVAVINDNIIVNQPSADALVASPLSIEGLIHVGLGQVAFKLLDADNQIVSEGSAVAFSDNSSWSFYSGSLEFSPPASPTVWLEVYPARKKNSTKKNLVKLPVKFKDYQESFVTVYFSNPKLDSSSNRCGQVYPVKEAVEYTPQLIFRALDRLLAGPTEDQKKAGYSTNLPAVGEVKAQKVDIIDGRVYVDFNATIQSGLSDACQIQSLRAQIVETLKIFSDTDEFIITIDGQAKNVLQ